MEEKKVVIEHCGPIQGLESLLLFLVRTVKWRENQALEEGDDQMGRHPLKVTHHLVTIAKDGKVKVLI